MSKSSVFPEVSDDNLDALIHSLFTDANLDTSETEQQRNLERKLTLDQKQTLDHTQTLDQKQTLDPKQILQQNLQRTLGQKQIKGQKKTVAPKIYVIEQKEILNQTPTLEQRDQKQLVQHTQKGQKLMLSVAEDEIYDQKSSDMFVPIKAFPRPIPPSTPLQVTQEGQELPLSEAGLQVHDQIIIAGKSSNMFVPVKTFPTPITPATPQQVSRLASRQGDNDQDSSSSETEISSFQDVNKVARMGLSNMPMSQVRRHQEMQKKIQRRQATETYPYAQDPYHQDSSTGNQVTCVQDLRESAPRTLDPDLKDLRKFQDLHGAHVQSQSDSCPDSYKPAPHTLDLRQFHEFKNKHGQDVCNLAPVCQDPYKPGLRTRILDPGFKDLRKFQELHGGRVQSTSTSGPDSSEPAPRTLDPAFKDLRKFQEIHGGWVQSTSTSGPDSSEPDYHRYCPDPDVEDLCENQVCYYRGQDNYSQYYHGHNYSEDNNYQLIQSLSSQSGSTSPVVHEASYLTDESNIHHKLRSSHEKPLSTVDKRELTHKGEEFVHSQDPLVHNVNLKVKDLMQPESTQAKSVQTSLTEYKPKKTKFFLCPFCPCCRQRKNTKTNGTKPS